MPPAAPALRQSGLAVAGDWYKLSAATLATAASLDDLPPDSPGTREGRALPGGLCTCELAQSTIVLATRRLPDDSRPWQLITGRLGEHGRVTVRNLAWS